MDDLISRQAAVRWVKTECNPYGKPTLDFESGKKVIEHLEQMPSANRPQGEWIDRSDGGRILNPWWENYECNRCGYYGSGTWNFCPNCGCRMKGADDE